jgi:hypothetical protein
VSAPRWVPVEEALPPTDAPVILHRNGCWVLGERGVLGEVTHWLDWRPGPAPKEESNDRE